MEKIIIYGAGKMGQRAYECLKNKYIILFFVDKDANKWEGEIKGLKVFPPSKLEEHKSTKVMVASIYYKEILQEINMYSIADIYIWSAEEKNVPNLETQEQLNKRTIDIGVFFQQQVSFELNNLTFIPGGSLLLDYAFIKMIANVFERKVYLEVGTYIGESIKAVIDICDKCYSVTAPVSSNYGMLSWCKNFNLPHHSGKLVDTERCTTYYMDSKEFDFSKIGSTVDLYFIDGDHSYEGVYNDTKNIFSVMKEDAIVIWHDVRCRSLEYNGQVVCAIRDVLQEKFVNFFTCNNNLCGIYLPEQYQNHFSLKELKYEENAPLYTYDIKVEKIQVK